MEDFYYKPFEKARRYIRRYIRNSLFSINPKGVFQEKAVWSIVLGSRKEKK